MANKPILFSGPMVRAILAGRKRHTRRIVKGTEDCEGMDLIQDRKGEYFARGWWSSDGATQTVEFEPLVQPGHTLWVREAWCQKFDDDGPVYNDEGNLDASCVYYRADGIDVFRVDGDGFFEFNKDGSQKSAWRPSIHMPRWASRITLKVTAVRVERLQDISEADAKAEGMRSYEFIPDDGFPYCIGWTHLQKDDGKSGLHTTAKSAFEVLWRKINGPDSWDADPWVWVYEFKREQQP